METLKHDFGAVGRLIPQKAVAKDLGICVRTITRRLELDPEFPRPIVKDRRFYFAEAQIENYKTALVRRALSGQGGGDAK